MLGKELIVRKLTGAVIEPPLILHQAAIVRVADELTLTKKTLGNAFHLLFMLLFLFLASEVVLVVEGLNQRLQLHDLYHVHFLQVFCEDGIRWVLGNRARRAAVTGGIGDGGLNTVANHSLQFLFDGEFADVLLESHKGRADLVTHILHLSLLIQHLEQP